MTTANLVNLTGKPVFVRAGSVLVRLVEAAGPKAVEMNAQTPERTLAIEVGGVAATLKEIDMISPLVSGPPVLEGVQWLVSSQALAEFPHREDFLRAATYTLIETGAFTVLDEDREAVRDAELVPGHLMILTAVTRSPRVAGPQAVDINEIDEPAGNEHRD